jgi:enoyl-CoA hydratase/carnithine racemase
MAMDVRFASRERAIFGQLEIGCGAIPGGGGLEPLHALAGRGRALEVIVSGEDYDAETAERYGWINRAVPDAGLDDVVEHDLQQRGDLELNIGDRIANAAVNVG